MRIPKGSTVYTIDHADPRPDALVRHKVIRVLRDAEGMRYVLLDSDDGTLAVIEDLYFPEEAEPAKMTRILGTQDFVPEAEPVSCEAEEPGPVWDDALMVTRGELMAERDRFLKFLAELDAVWWDSTRTSAARLRTSMDMCADMRVELFEASTAEDDTPDDPDRI